MVNANFHLKLNFRCSANKRGQEGPGVNNCPQQVPAPKDRHNSETLFKFSEEDNILSESGGPEGGANEDETDRYAHLNHLMLFK